MWNIKLKATNDQIRKTNKQKLVDTDNISGYQREGGGGGFTE